jgi:hypothetical protein
MREYLKRLEGAMALLLIAACAVDSSPPPPPSDSTSAAVAVPNPAPAAAPVAQLVDSAIPRAIAGTGGWNYQQSAEADLDGDGVPERVVLTAQVELYRDRPAWDDGQPWQVYIESRDSVRSYVYAQRLQLGTLAMRVAGPDSGQPASVVLLEQLPDQLGVYEVSYKGPGQVTAVVRFRRALDPRGETASPRLP